MDSWDSFGVTITEAGVVRAGEIAPDGFYCIGGLYAVWDACNRILGEYLRHNPEYGLPEFRPLVWVGAEAEPLRRVCAGPRAWVKRLPLAYT